MMNRKKVPISLDKDVFTKKLPLPKLVTYVVDPLLGRMDQRTLKDIVL